MWRRLALCTMLVLAHLLPTPSYAAPPDGEKELWTAPPRSASVPQENTAQVVAWLRASYGTTVWAANETPEEVALLLAHITTELGTLKDVRPGDLLMLAAMEQGWKGGNMGTLRLEEAPRAAGPRGPFQWTEGAWEGWRSSHYRTQRGVWLTDPSRLAEGGGMGCDGDGDEIADPENWADAACAAANHLRHYGATASRFENDPDRAMTHLEDALAYYHSGEGVSRCAFHGDTGMTTCQYVALGKTRAAYWTTWVAARVAPQIAP